MIVVMIKKSCVLIVSFLFVSLCIAEQTENIHYPRKDVHPEEVFTQETLERSIDYLFSWQQSAGSFGHLVLHSCWAIDGVIGRKYHGQYTSANFHYIQFMLALYEETGDSTWKRRAEDVVSNLMFLQAKSGGFYHGAAENEPAYNEGTTCAIHQGMPILGLLAYAGKPYANPELKKEIKEVVDTHWTWFHRHFFKRGTRGVTGQEGWPWPCWSGVTNQDLVVIEALAVYGDVFGDMSRYEAFGKPALDVLLSDRYYYKGLGLFQRGDQPDWNFPERTPYYHLVFSTLKRIHEITGDERIPPILEDVCEQLFRATFVAEDGLRYFSHGVNVKPVGGTLKVVSYNKYPTGPGKGLSFLDFFDWYLERHPDAEKQRIRDEVYQTAAAYVFANGTLARAFNPDNDVFALAPDLITVPTFLLSALKGTIRNFDIEGTPAVQRKIDDLVWYEKGQFYEVTKEGARTFAGFKLEQRAIVHGPDETLAGVDFGKARQYGNAEKVMVEVMDLQYDTERTFSPPVSSAVITGEPALGVTAMTFNVRYPADKDTGEKSWAVRKDLVISIVRKNHPDFLGTQEIVPEYLPFLEKQLPEYAHVGRFRKGDGDRFDECSKIFYRTDRWEIAEGDTGSFQLSDTPEVVGSRDWTSMARVTTWGRFREKTSGRTLYVFNTHWDHRTGRDESSLLSADRIAARRVPEDPVLFMGDFNQRQHEKSIRHLLGEHVFDVQPPIAMVDTDPEVKKIDHVLVMPRTAKIIEAGVIVERFDVEGYEQVRPSDHDPTLAIIEF